MQKKNEYNEQKQGERFITKEQREHDQAQKEREKWAKEKKKLLKRIEHELKRSRAIL